MINWVALGANSLWLLGLAFILAAASFAHYGRVPWRLFLAGRGARGGALLVCAGRLLVADWWLEQALCTLAGVWLAAGLWRDRGRGVAPPAPAPAHGAHLEPPAGRGLRRLAERLVRTELLWLALLAPFCLFPQGGRVVALAGIPVLWLLRRVARGRFVPATPLDGALAVLLGMVLVSLTATFDLTLSLDSVARLLLGIALYYALVAWATTDRRLAAALGGYALAGGLLAGIGLLAGSTGDKFPILSRLTAQGGHLGAPLSGALHSLQGRLSEFNPNIIGGALLWIVPLQLALAAWVWTASGRRAGFGLSRRPAAGVVVVALRLSLPALALLGVAMLVLTQSRSALAGALVGGALLLWLGGRRTRLLLAAGLLVGLIGAVILGPPGVTSGLQALVQAGSGPTDSRGTLAGRLDIWARAIYGIGAFPLTGMGMDTFGTLLPIAYPLFPVATVDPLAYAEVRHAHNQWLQVALDLGLPGLVAFAAIWLLAVRLLVATWRVAESGWRAVTAGLAAGLLAYGVFGLGDTVIFVARPDLLFWALLALLVALGRRTTAAVA